MDSTAVSTATAPAAATAPAPVAPPDRSAALDVVRGLAVLGILVMNIVEFGQPLRAYENPTGGGGSTGIDRWAWFVQFSLFDGRMRGLFSMLFGAGLVLITERLERSGHAASAVDLWLRRCLWLVLFGVLHRFALQWTGDILYMYGLLGLIAVAFRKLRPRGLMIAGALCLLAFTPIELWRHHQAAQLRSQAAEAVQLAKAEQPVPPALQAARKRWEDRLAPPKPDASAAEIEAMRGGYTTVFAYRWNYHHTFQSSYIYYHFVWDVLGMVFIGMALTRLGFFAGHCRTGVYAAMIAAAIALTIGSFLWAQEFANRNFSAGELEMKLWQGIAHPFVRGLVGLGWAAALILLVQRGLLRWLTAPLGLVGRMAFTNYVLQTVCCTLFFFGYGLGYYAELSRAQLMLVWLGVSLVQVLASWLWLSRFRLGPLEWAWRSLTYGRWQPLRTAAAPAA
ncbi:MAG TPA: DUF418 domain-containing protein [Planctomycetota bacterium]